jgi:hypothetical protein
MLIDQRRVRDQESRARKREERDMERMERLETMVNAQTEKLDKLEDLVYRIMHRSRVNFDNNPESPKYEKFQGPIRQRNTISELENLDPAQQEPAEPACQRNI